MPLNSPIFFETCVNFYIYHHFPVTSPKTNMTMAKIANLKVHFLLNMVIFQPSHVSFQGCLSSKIHRKVPEKPWPFPPSPRSRSCEGSVGRSVPLDNDDGDDPRGAALVICYIKCIYLKCIHVYIFLFIYRMYIYIYHICTICFFHLQKT